MSQSRPSFNTWTALVVLAVLSMAYIGGYYATVERVIIDWSRLEDTIPHYSVPWVPDVVPHWFFAPIHAIDRRIRPDFWW
jgi:hypothetical protein